MSLKTWKKKHYPITALQAHKTLNLVELVEHSITKWVGLRPKNLEKHDLEVNQYGEILDEDDKIFEIDALSCSLCRRFLNWKKEDFDYNKDCIGCPIYESRGGFRCFEYMPKEGTPDSPFGHWRWEHNPEPMIKALRKALRWAKKQEA